MFKVHTNKLRDEFKKNKKIIYINIYTYIYISKKDFQFCKANSKKIQI